MALSDLMQQPQDDPATLAALAQQFSSQDQASADAYAANGNAHSAPAPMPGVAPAYQGQALFPTAPQVAPAAPVRIPFPTGNASPTAGGVASPSLALIPGAGRAAGWQPSSKSAETTSSPYSPDTVASKIGELGARADQREAQAQYDAVRGQLGQYGDAVTSAYDQAQSAQDRLRIQHEVNAVKDYDQKIQGVMQDAASDTVDPMKWFNDKSTGSKILYSLGSMLQGFGYGYSGRGINPQKAINDQIRASVEAQQQNHQAKLTQVGQMQNVYSRMRESFGNDESAAKALELAQRQAVISHLDRSANDAATPYASRLMAANLKLGLQQDQSNTMADLDHHQLGDIKTKSDDVFKPAAPAGANIGVWNEATLPDGSKHRTFVPMATAKEAGLLPKDQLEAQKTQAEIRKTTADAAVAEGKAAAASGADPILESVKKFAGDVSSTRWNPTTGFSGSEANLKNIDTERYNAARTAGVISVLGRGAERNQQLIQSLDAAFKVEPSMTPAEQQHKIHSFIDWYANMKKVGANATTPGEGAEEQ